MRIEDIILTANNNLRRNKVRTILTMVAVFIGSFTLLVAEGVGTGFKQYVEKNLETGSSQMLRLTKKNANRFINFNDVTKYKEDSESDASSSNFRMSDISYLKATYSSIIKDVFLPQYLSARYITRNDRDKYNGYVGIMYPETAVDFVAGKMPVFNQIVINEDFVESLGFLNSNDALGKTVIIRFDGSEKIYKDFSLVISGVIHKSQTTTPIMMDHQTATYINSIVYPESVNPMEMNSVQIYIEKLSTKEMADFKKKLENAGIEAMSYEDEKKKIFEVVNGLKAAMMGVAAISLAVATFGIVNTVLMGILERTKEIGLMKALGSSKGTIFKLFTFEAVCIGFWGFIISLTTSLLAGLIVNPMASKTFLKEFDGFTLFVLTPESMFKIFLIVLTVSFVASFFPSLRASKLNSIEALRSE